MLLNYQEIGSDSVKRELGLVQQVYTQDAFLKGLFLGSRLPEDLEGFRVFKDPINLDFRIQTPDYCNDEPEKWEFQNLPYILDDEQGRVTSEGVYSDFNYRLAVQEKYKKVLWGFTDDFGAFPHQRISALRTKEHDLAMQKNFSLTSTNVEYIFHHLIPDIVHAHFVMIVDAAIFGGLDNSPILKRVLDCYRLGGMPGGWVGPLPEDGGTPEQCMELYHLGN
ncbi:hypothetical protein C3B51_23510 [Pseudoalteromonas rubra]|uniref:Uncharacterized protein n=1 Tax=Pseudoalteromonas rubra TaxID=43658 RepID=A0A4Q7DYT9_9GAMM|nr:hypothetical protein [Pseudoalteromonas rubra]RZM69424.1 hypothetical protein C3B51_23510 [Pseudoalteromonas rubra]